MAAKSTSKKSRKPAKTRKPAKAKVEFVPTNGKPGKVETRAKRLMTELGKARRPMTLQELLKKTGGESVQLNPMLALLHAQGAVVKYRAHTGTRQGGGVAYQRRDKVESKS